MKAADIIHETPDLVIKRVKNGAQLCNETEAATDGLSIANLVDYLYRAIDRYPKGSIELPTPSHLSYKCAIVIELLDSVIIGVGNVDIACGIGSKTKRILELSDPTAL